MRSYIIIQLNFLKYKECVLAYPSHPAAVRTNTCRIIHSATSLLIQPVYLKQKRIGMRHNVSVSSPKS